MELRTLMVVGGLAFLQVACPGSSTTHDSAASDLAADGPVDTGADTVDVPADVGTDTGPAGPSGVGTECETDQVYPPGQGTCAEGQLCLSDELGLTNGYCTMECQGGPCPADAACIGLYGGRIHFCMRRCTSNADCRAEGGYSCTSPEPGNPVRVCMISEAPAGTRPDGTACFTTTAGPHQLAPLPRTVFTSANVPASRRPDSRVEAEGNVAINAANGHAVNTYIGTGEGDSYIGASRTTDGTGWTNDGRVTDPLLPSACDSVLDYGRDGTLRMVFLGLRRTAGYGIDQIHVRVTQSTDEGAHWTTPVRVDPLGFCPVGGLCDKPWILSGPSATTPGSDALYIGYLQMGPRTGGLYLQRSDDGGANWMLPQRMMAVGLFGSTTLEPNLLQLSLATNGTLGAAWIGIPISGESRVTLGHPDARVIFRRTTDGGTTWEDLRVVSRRTDSPVFTQPPVVLDGPEGRTVHVAYASGTPDGKWDILLATSTDAGMTWRYRQVNDEPGDPCATHHFPTMALDPVTHDLHLLWMENRFGDGGVTYARCPADPATPCGANEAVADRPFTFTTSRNGGVWHGDYQGLAISGRDIWATWSDTRDGQPHMYATHGTLR